MKALNAKFSEHGIQIDESVYNAARISKAYGTIAKKGDDHPKYPHRLSKMLDVPVELIAVSEAKLRELAELAPQPDNGQPYVASNSTFAAGPFDVDSFLQRNGIKNKGRASYAGKGGAGHKWILEQCPLCQENGGSAVVMQWSDGKLAFRCHHNRCTGKGWKEFRAVVEPQSQRNGREYSPPEVSNRLIEYDPSHGSNGSVSTQPSPRIEFQRITSQELDSGDFAQEYLVEGVMVAQQPMIVAGPQKTLKTSVMIDLAVSLATCGHFLGRFNVNRAAHVAFMSGESGLATIQETARRICKAAGSSLSALNIIWSPDLPRFDKPGHHDALAEFLVADEIETLVIDPAYLAMPGADAGNLFVQGELLRTMTEVCGGNGVQLILAHHTKNRREPYEPPELSDIAWSGFQEFARQWILLGRRERYEPGTGQHQLWLVAGGSAGHSGLWAMDVESVFVPGEPRQWRVGIQNAMDAKRDAKQAQDREREDRRLKKQEQQESDWKRELADYLKDIHPSGDTQNGIVKSTSLSVKSAPIAIRHLKAEGRLERCDVAQGNNQSYHGWRYVHVNGSK